MVEQLYNKGSDTHGRPATIGSLLAMLKEDRPEVFSEVIRIDSQNANNYIGLTHNEIKQMMEQHEAGDKIHEYETQEDKLCKWLKKPEFHLHHKVCDPRNALQMCTFGERWTDVKKMYNSKHMKPYPKSAENMVIKLKKAQVRLIR